MSHLETTGDQGRYNEVAIKYAGKIHRSRSASKLTSQPAVDDLFPSFNRAGLGIYREYERMGNQPVTDALQAQADLQGVTFEHLGLSIGTVLHDVDLKQTLSSATIKLIRETLLERKVIFFRNQNLVEDEQVKFGRCFGELDAFPFGKSGDNPYTTRNIRGLKMAGTQMLLGWKNLRSVRSRSALWCRPLAEIRFSQIVMRRTWVYQQKCSNGFNISVVSTTTEFF
jgi:hypothetical protein